MNEIDKKILHVLKNYGAYKKYPIREAFKKFHVENLYFIRNIQTCDICKKEFPVHDEEFEFLGLEEIEDGYSDVFDLDDGELIQMEENDFIYYPDFYDYVDPDYRHKILCPDCEQ